MSTNKLIKKSKELFESQFAWTHIETIGHFLIFRDYDNHEFCVCAIAKDKLWKRKGFKYETIIVPSSDVFLKETFIDYYCFMNKSRNRAFICEGSDLIKQDNIIYRNYQTEHKTYYNAPCYEIHLSMCELFEEREDGWYECNAD